MKQANSSIRIERDARGAAETCACCCCRCRDLSGPEPDRRE